MASEYREQLDNSETESDNVQALIDEYSFIYKGYQHLDSSGEPSNSDKYQENLSSLVRQAEKLVHGVNKHNLFSVNERLEELPADHLRFILLPALLGYFSSKHTLMDKEKGDPSTYRRDSVNKSKTYYKDFLRLCKLYGVHTPLEEEAYEANEDTEEERKISKKDAITRKTEKVLRYKAQKSLDGQLQDLFAKMSLDYIDDSTKIEYYTRLIDRWVLTAVEELEFIEEELAILEYMSKMKSEGGVVKPPAPKGQASRPFILTKSDLQKQVFGLGYPSIPTYTVEEFYDAQVQAGQIPPSGSGGPQGAEAEAEAAEQQEIVKEYNIERDDPESLNKAREWDDWKDDHRRGWGNRKNMG